MKTITLTSCICLVLLLGAGVALAGVPMPVDGSSGGVEVTAPDEFIFHNLFFGSTYNYGVFKWDPRKHVWYPTYYGLEDPTFNTQEYYPFDVGRSWTYSLSSGGSNTLTITGTEEICGQTCFRQDSSGGGVSYWINDEAGVSMTKMVNADGSYTDFCPPLKLSPPQLYLGMLSLHPFYDAPYFYAPGVPAGTLDGWSHFVCKGLEDVTVPAGIFPDCIRNTFIFSYTATDGSYAVRTEETWHAQGIGVVKRVQVAAYGIGGYIYHSEASSYDLTSYTLP